jgi:hypothetical protein
VKRRRRLDLAGVAEASEIVGVSRQRLLILRQGGDFPAPVALLVNGPVWLADDLRAYAAIPRMTGRPRKDEQR